MTDKTPKQTLTGSYGICNICKKTIKHNERWLFVEIPNNTTTNKVRQHYDCDNPTKKY